MVTEPTKVCARCRKRKPFSAFSTRTRWEDGTTRTVIAYCRPCANEKRKQCFAQHPGSKAESCRRYRERLKHDPERLAEYREKQRIYNRVYFLRRGRDVGKFTKGEPRQYVAAEPFAAWLRYVIERDCSTQIETATRLRISEKAMRDVLHGRRQVELGTVERALIADDTITLRELYGAELYGEAA